MFDACYSCYFLQEEHYDCLGETLKDGIAHFPVHNLQLDTEFLQRQQSLDLQANGQLAVHSLMGLVLNDDPPQLEWSSPFPLASSSPGTRQDNVGVVKPHHKEQAQGDRFMFERLSSDRRITARPLCLCISISRATLLYVSSFAYCYVDSFFVCSDLPGSSSVLEAGALQLSPVDPEEGLSEAGMIPGDQTRMVLGSDGDKDRSGKKSNPKLKYLACFSSVCT